MSDLNNEIPNTGRFEISFLPQLKHKRQKLIALDLFDKAGPHQHLMVAIPLCDNIEV
jgi:hypothetical protein